MEYATDLKEHPKTNGLDPVLGASDPFALCSMSIKDRARSWGKTYKLSIAMCKHSLRDERVGGAGLWSHFRLRWEDQVPCNIVVGRRDIHDRCDIPLDLAFLLG